MKPTFGAGVVAMSIGMGLLGGSALARQARQDPDVLNALLLEVRGLRAAIEELAATGPRVQLTMGRLQMQEQRIDAMTKRQTEVRDRRIEAEAVVGQAKNMLVVLERELRTSTDPGKREQIDNSLEEHRRLMAEAMAKVRHLATEEAAIAQDVSLEQAQWTEISRRLDELDRMLNRK